MMNYLVCPGNVMLEQVPLEQRLFSMAGVR